VITNSVVWVVKQVNPSALSVTPSVDSLNSVPDLSIYLQTAPSILAVNPKLRTSLSVVSTLGSPIA
jgi:hypothetical protein